MIVERLVGCCWNKRSDAVEYAVVVLPVTSTLMDAPLLRLTVEPDAGNRLRATSQIMLDKPMTVKADKIGPAFGSLDDVVMVSVSRSLALFLGLAG